MKGLVSLGFVLLGVGSQLGRDIIAEKQWELGINIFVELIKKKRHIASTVIQTICNHILTDSNPMQYIRLYHFVVFDTALDLF